MCKLELVVRKTCGMIVFEADATNQQSNFKDKARARFNLRQDASDQ